MKDEPTRKTPAPRPPRAGDDDAWRDFFGRHDGLIRSVVRWSRWRFERHVQDDMVQNIRAELLSTIPKTGPIDNVESFIKKICVRRCIDEVRRQVRAQEIFVRGAAASEAGEHTAPEPDAGGGFDPVRTIISSERAAALHRLLERLDPTCQAAIRQFYLDGKSYKEMADTMGLSINTVGSRLAKCLTKLRRLVEKDPNLREDNRH